MDEAPLIFIQAVLCFIFSFISFLILKQETYQLISGFGRRPQPEQEELIKRGYPQAMGKVMLLIAIVFGLGAVLALFGIPYVFIGSMGVMLIVIIGGLFYVQKYELPEKRTKGYWMAGVGSFITIGIIGFVIGMGSMDNNLSIENNHVAISGIYGVEWSLDTIEEVKLLDELPEVKVRTNGYSLAGQLKGNFLLEEYGDGLLFIHGEHSPYLYIANEEEYLIINGDDPKETKKWYKEVSGAIN